MDKLVVLAVGGVVAVGTVLYYLLTKEKPMQTRSRPSDRSSSTRPSSPPTSYSDIKLSRNPKNIPKKGSPEKNISEPDKESGKISKMNRSSAIPSISGKTENDVQSSQENFDNSYPFSAMCQAECGKPANATVYPCKHKVFCLEHAEYYFTIARKIGREPKCPIDSCHRVIEYFTG